ncbi:MAG: sugar ABC transporter permease [Chloroflexi bacterium]|nr:sugar ABC transporter permease [Chloroflexota bacterium]
MTATSVAPKSSGGFANWWRHTATTRTAWLYLLPAFIVMGLITFYPLFYQVWMSTTDYDIKNLRIDSPAPNPAYLSEACQTNLKGECTWGIFENYHQIFTGSLPVAIANFSFWKVLAFDLVWTFTNVPFHIVIGVLIAVLLNTKGLWFKRFYRAIFVLPMVIPSLVIAVVWRNMFDPDFGSINQMLTSVSHLFGGAAVAWRWIDQVNPPIPWLPLPLSYFALLIANIWLGWPFMTIVATGALQSIPVDLYEAASIDGASGRQQFTAITVPLLRPAIIPAAVLGMITTFNLFNLIYLLSGGGPLRQTEILVTTAYRLVNENRLYGIASAFSVIIFLVLLILTLATNYITKSTERYDA